MMNDVLLSFSNLSIHYEMIGFFLSTKTFLNEGFDSNKRARIEEFEKPKSEVEVDPSRRQQEK